MSNLQAAESMVAALRGAGRLEPVDDALVMAVLSLAESVDVDRGNAALWSQYRAAMESLRSLEVGDDDSLERLLSQLAGGADVRDTGKSEPPEPGKGSRKRR